MSLYPATACIRHLLTARSASGHGVHSPFVYDFLTNVVRGKSDEQIVCEVERLRREMLDDRRTIRVTDLGAGSSGRSGQERRIHEIASTAPLPARQAALLSRISATIRSLSLHRSGTATETVGADEHRERRGVTLQGSGVPEPGGQGIILELGTSLGISTLALALSAPESRVVTIEGCPELAGVARENLLRHGALNAEVINMEFSAALDQLQIEERDVSLAFIDGNHRGEALREYARRIREAGEEMIIVADDIHMNRDMYSAWSSLTTPSTEGLKGTSKSPQAARLTTAPPELTPTTIETFRFGIILCFRNLTPGRYRIRY